MAACRPPIPPLGCPFSFFSAAVGGPRLPLCRRVQLCPIREGNPWDDPGVWVNPRHAAGMLTRDVKISPVRGSTDPFLYRSSRSGAIADRQRERTWGRQPRALPTFLGPCRRTTVERCPPSRAIHTLAVLPCRVSSELLIVLKSAQTCLGGCKQSDCAQAPCWLATPTDNKKSRLSQ